MRIPYASCVWYTHLAYGILPEVTEFPPVLQAAWGLSSRAGKPALSVERIVAAAVRIAAAEGMAAVSMNRIAADLGSAPMSLYRHVRSKDELLTLMLEVPFVAVPDLPAGADWRAGLAAWSRELLAVYRANSWLLAIPITGLPATPNQLRWMDAALGCMAGTDLSGSAKLSVGMLLSVFVRSYAALGPPGSAVIAADDETATAQRAAYGEMLLQLIDKQTFPHLAAVLDQATIGAPDTADAEFDFGLERILDGVATLIGSPR
jgi:AcrR family transcriptional regulator